MMALRNLLGNALKFHAPDSPPRIKITASDDANETLVTVSDQGVGFDMQYYDDLFKLFRRLHREEDFPGSGVGLALVHKAIQRMGGRVWAESVPNQGSTFYLSSPAQSIVRYILIKMARALTTQWGSLSKGISIH